MVKKTTMRHRIAAMLAAGREADPRFRNAEATPDQSTARAVSGDPGVVDGDAAKATTEATPPKRRAAKGKGDTNPAEGAATVGGETVPETTAGGPEQ